MNSLAVASLICFASLYGADPVCATRQDLVGACFKVDGALQLSNGTPSARIVVRKSRRVLGVEPYVSDNNETFAAPGEVRAMASFDYAVRGTYLVCPVSKRKAGQMQRVCIESAAFPVGAGGK